MSHTRSTSLLIIILVLSSLAGIGGYLAAGRINQPPSPKETSEQKSADSTAPRDVGSSPTSGSPDPQPVKSDHTEKQPQAGGDKSDSHAPEAEISDLDRPVAEMWAAT